MAYYLATLVWLRALSVWLRDVGYCCVWIYTMFSYIYLNHLLSVNELLKIMNVWIFNQIIIIKLYTRVLSRGTHMLPYTKWAHRNWCLHRELNVSNLITPRSIAHWIPCCVYYDATNIHTQSNYLYMQHCIRFTMVDLLTFRTFS